MPPHVTVCSFCNKKGKCALYEFQVEALKRCKKILKVRNEFQLKYANIHLPETPNEIQGYHAKCYKQFTAIQKKYYDKSNKINDAIQPYNPVEDSVQPTGPAENSLQRDGPPENSIEPCGPPVDSFQSDEPPEDAVQSAGGAVTSTL